MQFTTRAMLIVTLIVLSGCARMKVTSSHDSSFDFSRISTYQWIAAPEELPDKSEYFIHQDLHRALNNELAARGWKQVLAASNATVQATYYITIESHNEYADNRAAPTEGELIGGVVYNRGGNGTWSRGEVEQDLIIYQVEVGTAHLTIKDTVTGNTVWQGTLASKSDLPYLKSLPDEAPQIARKLIVEIPNGTGR